MERLGADSIASAPAQTPTKKISISPAVRKIAVENDIDWHSLSGTGPGGRIVADDVRKAMQSGVDRGAPLSAVRQAIAARTLESIKAPQAALCREIDVTAAIENRGEISLTTLIASAAARVLELVPVLNARWEGERLCVCDRVNIGIVLAIPGGIIVPVIHDATHKSPVDMDLEWKRLVKAAGEGALTREQVNGGTFTVSNAGPLGIDFFSPCSIPRKSQPWASAPPERGPWWWATSWLFAPPPISAWLPTTGRWTPNRQVFS